MGPVAGEGDVFICAERSARNMSYQGLSAVRGATSCVGSWLGEALLGLPLAAPYAVYDTVYTLPLLTISMKKGTGVVTRCVLLSRARGTPRGAPAAHPPSLPSSFPTPPCSVPSDAPDDWAALRDLREKPKLREKYGLTEEMVAPAVVEIIDIPGYGRAAALAVCDQLKIRSQNDAVLLKQAKDLVCVGAPP